MAHTKSGGSTKLGRDSIAKRLGVKRQEGQAVAAGEVLIRQRGTKYLSGKNVKRGADDTLYAACAGKIKFSERKKEKFDGRTRNAKVISIEV